MSRTITLSLKELSRHEVTRFLVVGVFSFLVEFCVFLLLIDVFGIAYTSANLPAMCVATVVNYYLTRKHVFVSSSRYNQKRTFILFVLFTVAGVLLNQFFLWFFVEKISMDIRLSKVFAVGFVAVFNYFTKKHFVF